MEKMKRVFLIHGWGARPDEHWFPWLTAELKARHFEVFAPAMPHTDSPMFSEWLDMITSWVGKPDVDTYFVGHSLGCITIARYLESLPAEKIVGKCIFVGGFKDDIGFPEIQEFTAKPLDVSKIKTHGASFVVIASDNDDTVPLTASIALAHALDAKVIIEKGKGHFTKDDHVISMPSVLSELLSMSP